LLQIGNAVEVVVMKITLMGEDVRSSMKPTDHVFSLGRFSEESGEEKKEDVTDWARTCPMGVGRSTLGHSIDGKTQRGTHPSFLMMDDEYLGYARTCQLESMLKEWNHIRLEAWVHWRGWMSPLTQP
jgi:hypothetical protein